MTEPGMDSRAGLAKPERVGLGDPPWRRFVPSWPRNAAAPPQPAVLVLSSRHRLWQRHGAEGVFAVERAVGDLMVAMGERGLSATLLYADDSPLLGRLGLLPADVTDPASVTRLVQAVTQRLCWTEEQVRYLLILGDDDVVPFHRLENPALDADASLLSDYPYGAHADAHLLPALSVGRLPDVGLELLLSALAAAADAHRALARGAPATAAAGAFGYSASVWKRAARQVFEPIGDPRALRLSPPLSHRELPAAGPAGPRYRYYNLHGLEDAAEWFGQLDPAFPADYPGFPMALRPEDLPSAPGSVVFSEACYGAHLQGRAVHDSMALTHLAQGSLAFVGATGVAYGGLDGPLVAADRLARDFWRGVDAGLSAGLALAGAKAGLVRRAVEHHGYVDAEEEKAVLNFVLYGDPSLAHCAPSVWAEDEAARRLLEPVGRAGPMDWVGTPSVRPHSLAKESPEERLGLPIGLLDHVRRTVAHRLPEFAAADVEVAACSLPNVGVPHGRPCDGVRRMVVTLSKSMPTGSGPSCREVVRVTVDAAGAIRRVAVSR